jgi:Family of unknown function (DUF6131)
MPRLEDLEERLRRTGYRAATGVEQFRTGEGGLTPRRGNEQSPVGQAPRRTGRGGGAGGGGGSVIILGLVLLVIGFIAKIAILWTIGIIVLIIGVVLLILGSMGRPVGGRRHYW